MVQEAFTDLGWLVLQGRSLGDGAPDPRFILLHQDVGVVLLDSAPDRVPDAVERLRRRLHVVRFGQHFPGHLPVIYCSLTEQDLWRLSMTLDTEFSAEQPMGLQDGEWMAALDSLLSSSASSPAMPRPRAARAEQPSFAPAAPKPQPRAAAPRPAAAQPPAWAQDGITEADFPALLPPSAPPRAFNFGAAGSAALVLLAMAASGAVLLEHLAPQQAGPAWRNLAGLLGGDGTVVPDAAPRQVLTAATAEAAPALPVPRPVALTPQPPSAGGQEEGGRISARAEAPQRALPPLPATAMRSLRGETPPVPLVNAEVPPFLFLSAPSAEAARLVAATVERPPLAPAAAPLVLASTEPAPLAAAADPVAASPSAEAAPMAAPEEPVATASPAPAEAMTPSLSEMLPGHLGGAAPSDAETPPPEAALAEPPRAGSTEAPVATVPGEAEPPQAEAAAQAPMPGDAAPVPSPAAPGAEQPPMAANANTAPAPVAATDMPAEPTEPAADAGPATITAQTEQAPQETTAPAPASPAMPPAEHGPQAPDATTRATPSPDHGDQADAGPAPSLAAPATTPAAPEPQAPPAAGLVTAPDPAVPAAALPEAVPPAAAPPPLQLAVPAPEAVVTPPVVEAPPPAEPPQARQPTGPQPAPLATAAPAREAARPAERPSAPVRPAAQPAPAMAPELLAALMRRGDAMLALGDLSAARLLYERATAGGSSGAALALGKTYDPAFLSGLNARGIRPDRAAAANWYRKAAALGDGEAPALLRQLGAE